MNFHLSLRLFPWIFSTFSTDLAVYWNRPALFILPFSTDRPTGCCDLYTAVGSENLGASYFILHLICGN
jgi:hypothetical protein